MKHITSKNQRKLDLTTVEMLLRTNPLFGFEELVISSHRFED
ncbi:hypothetical protein SynSYN20_02096 [Synechococcus sp. SYN20]|nr:hypothetical protein SynSYN20_02096 [Synechococcus sp. SYN20]